MCGEGKMEAGEGGGGGERGVGVSNKSVNFGAQLNVMQINCNYETCSPAFGSPPQSLFYSHCIQEERAPIVH